MSSAPRTVRDLSDHPAVEVVVNETATGSGYWVYLRPGYVWDGTTSHVHEPTVKACCEAMADVRWDPIAWGHACGASADEVAQLQRLRDAVGFRTLNEVRAEAKRRGMRVVQQRRYRDRPFYHCYESYWAGDNLQQLAGDTTPSVHWLDGLPALLAWANLQWPAVDNPLAVPASVDQVHGR